MHPTSNVDLICTQRRLTSTQGSERRPRELLAQDTCLRGMAGRFPGPLLPTAQQSPHTSLCSPEQEEPPPPCCF